MKCFVGDNKLYRQLMPHLVLFFYVCVPISQHSTQPNLQQEIIYSIIPYSSIKPFIYGKHQFCSHIVTEFISQQCVKAFLPSLQWFSLKLFCSSVVRPAHVVYLSALGRRLSDRGSVLSLVRCSRRDTKFTRNLPFFFVFFFSLFSSSSSNLLIP